MVTRFFDYQLSLNAPLLIATAEGDPNSVETASFVPGSALRGAVAAALHRAQSRDFEQVVLSGAVRFLNAYPVVRQADASVIRALPVPRSWRAEKYDETSISDFAADVEPNPDVQYARPGFDFVAPLARFRSADPSVHRNFHQQRSRAKGRPTEAEGAIFTYEALDAGSVFMGVIAIAGPDPSAVASQAAAIQALFNGNAIRLGRSRNTQYGGEAQVAWIGNPRSREIPDWGAIVSRRIDAGTIFRLMLTSPAILRSTDGQVDPAAIETAVTAALPVTVEARFVSTVMTGGFNATWRLALPQAAAVAGGSVLVLKAKESIPLAAIEAFEAQGIGERRTEGFGCIVALHAPSPRVVVEEPPQETEPVPAPSERPAALEGIQRRLYDQAVARAVALRAAEIANAARGDIPSRALIGRLRATLPQQAGGTTQLAALLTEGPQGLKRPARRQLEALRIQNKPLDEWLGSTIGTSDIDLDRLASTLFDQPLERHAITGTVDVADRRALARAAQPRFVDTVLAILAKRSAGV